MFYPYLSVCLTTNWGLNFVEIFCRSVVSVNFFRPALAVGCIIHEIWECENSIPMCAINVGMCFTFYSTPSTEGVESTRGNSVCLSVCLCVCLSVITFSFFEYSMIWWFRPCKPYIFWKLIMLATSTALFWPSTTEYQPVPPSTDQVFNDLMV